MRALSSNRMCGNQEANKDPQCAAGNMEEHADPSACLEGMHGFDDAAKKHQPSEY